MEAYMELIQATKELVDLSTKLKSNPDPSRNSGYVTYWALGQTMFSAGIGSLLPASADAYKAFSREKTFRVQADMMREPTTTVSSWQTRDTDMSRYGGSVICNLDGDRNKPHEIYSFSGLKEHVDEAVSLSLALEYGRVNNAFVQKVLDISKNGVFNELWEAWKKG